MKSPIIGTLLAAACAVALTAGVKQIIASPRLPALLAACEAARELQSASNHE